MSTDFRKYRLERISDLERFIKYDRERYLAYNARLQDTLDRLPTGRTLTARDYALPRQYDLFTKLCCLRCFISRMPANNDKPFTFEMLPDYSGIKKVARQ